MFQVRDILAVIVAVVLFAWLTALGSNQADK